MICYNFFGDREDCIMKIQNSINMYSKKELESLIPRSEYLSIIQRTRHIAVGARRDAQGEIRFSDEIDPKGLTDYLMETVGYTCARELAYACVCRSMVSIINEFYSDLNQDGYAMHGYHGNGAYSGISMEDYARAFESRKVFPHKKLRGKG